MDINLEELKSRLENKLNQKISFSHDDNDPINFYFESDLFELSFWIEGETFVIGNLEVFEQGAGIGGEIVNEIILFTKESKFEQIKAGKVKEGKFSFWEHFDFFCDDENCYFEF